MQNLYFDYYMRITYSEPAMQSHYTIKCIPATTERQRVERMEVEIEPKGGRTLGEDSFGNRFFYGSVDIPHDAFTFHSKGMVQTGLADCERAGEEEDFLYRYPSALTRPGEGLRAYYGDFAFSEGMSGYEKAVFLMHRLYRDFVYEKGVTGMDTTAEEAWNIGKGVCQDYAHILTALCRLAGIPARYVTGMMVGEGYSHAWVEVLVDGKWYALDPTNDLVVGEEHIKIGSGRDARDCMINKGIMKGGGKQTLAIRVKVSLEPVG